MGHPCCYPGRVAVLTYPASAVSPWRPISPPSPTARLSSRPAVLPAVRLCGASRIRPGLLSASLSGISGSTGCRSLGPLNRHHHPFRIKKRSLPSGPTVVTHHAGQLRDGSRLTASAEGTDG